MISAERLFQILLVQAIASSSLNAQQLLDPWASFNFSKDTSGVSFVDGAIEIRAKGLDMWNKVDDFHYVYQPLTGNGQITARIVDIPHGDEWAKGGIMFRNTLSNNSRHFSLLVTPNHGHAVQMRLHDANLSDGVSGMYGWTYRWLRLARMGKNIIGSISTNGKDWKVIYGNEIEFNTDFYVGFAASSHDSTRTFSMKFDNVSIINESADKAPPSAPQGASFNFISLGFVAVSWLPSIDDTNIFCYNVLSKGKRLNKMPIIKNTFVIERWNPSENSEIEIQAVDVTGKVSKSSLLTIRPPEAGFELKTPKINPLSRTLVPKGHWTDSLAWTNVINARAVDNLLGSENTVDSLLLHKTIQDLSSTGGGVIFFPGGSYYFKSSIYLKSGVILRGEDPVGVTDANDYNYSPLTKFIFPKYVPSYSGTGTSNHTAFKAIFADSSGIKNVGLVNIDINRACIRFDGSNKYMRVVESMQLEVPWFKKVHSNILIYGIRQNNAAIPSPIIPTKIQVDEGHAWQRWPWRYGFNISVSVSRNCAIINCRLNDDNEPENFPQPNYITDDLKMTSGHTSDFPFKTHFAVNINFARIYTNPADGKLAFDHPASYNSLFRNWSVYPELFVPGIEMKNNTVILSRMDLFSLNRINWMVPNSTILDNNVIGTCCEQEEYIRDNGHDLITNDWIVLAKDEKLLPKKRYVDTTDILPYRFLEPLHNDKTKQYPLIIFFHGVGEGGTDNESHLKNFASFFFRENVRKNYPAYVLMPQHNNEQQFSNGKFESDPPWPLVATLNIVDSLVQNLNVDKKRIYLVGLSSGAAAVWETIARYPKSFAAGLSFSGIYGQLVDKTLASRFTSAPVWHFHGVNDVSVPVKFVQAAFANLERYGVKNWKLKIYDGVAHGGWILAMEEPDLFEWLFTQHGGNFKNPKTPVK